MIIHLSYIHCLHERYVAIATPGEGSFPILRSLLTDTPPSLGKGWLHHQGLRLLLFLNSGVGSFMSHWNQIRKGLWDETYGFSSLSEKTKKSKHLQISLQRQHFLLSCFWRPWVYVGPTGVEPPTFHPADPHSPNWANQAVVNFCRNWKITKGL